MNEINTQGIWRSIEPDPGAEFFGTIVASQYGGGTLKLIGDSYSLHSFKKNIPRLMMASTPYGNVTVYLPQQEPNTIGRTVSEVALNCEFVFIGGGDTAPHESVRGFRMYQPNLIQWLKPEKGYDLLDKEEGEVHLALRRVEYPDLFSSKRCKIRLVWEQSTAGPLGDDSVPIRVKNEVCLEVRFFDSVPIDELQTFWRMFTVFFSFVFDCYVASGAMYVLSEAVGDNGRFDDWVRMYLCSVTHPRVERKPRDPIFSYMEVADNCESMISNWVKYYHESEDLFALFALPVAFDNRIVGSDFLAYARFFEAYDRSIANVDQLRVATHEDMVVRVISALRYCRKMYTLPGKESVPNFPLPFDCIKRDDINEVKQGIRQGRTTYRERMIRVYTDVAQEWGSDVPADVFAAVMLDNRNYYTHYDSRGKTRIFRREKLLRLNMLLRIMSQAIFLRILGVDESQASGFVKRRTEYARQYDFSGLFTDL